MTVRMNPSSCWGLAKNITSRCGVLVAVPHAHCQGASLPMSPSRRDRLGSVIPETNSCEKAPITDPSSLCAATPTAEIYTLSLHDALSIFAIALDTGADR